MSAPPARLGDRYEVGPLIGRGGMADVHRAHDTVLDRDVAVKLLRDVSSVDARRFDEEARLLATLDHPNIVALLDAGVTDERPWIALELIEGSTLSQLMSSGPLDEQTVTRIGRDVADGLAHAHSFGVVHRDVKPSNVVLSADGSAKLADFGIARLEDASSGITLTGHTVGTAAYLSPEQVRGEPITGAGDVYALGLVLLEALSGIRTYPGPPIEAAMARLHRSPLIPTSLPPGWPGLLASMTASAPMSRPTAADVAHRLGPEGSVTGRVDDPPTTSAVAIVTPPRRGRRLGFVLGAVAIALVLSLVLTRGLTGEAPDTAEAAAATPTAAPSATTSPSAKASQTPALDASTRSPSSTTTQQASSGTTTSGASKGSSKGSGTAKKPGKAKPHKAKANKHGKKKGKGKKHAKKPPKSKAKKPGKAKGKKK
ncbi:hypothetical protein BH09ACT12_BH09ACT12_16430 [soil metagenome]